MAKRILMVVCRAGLMLSTQANAALINSGDAEINGTFTFNFETGIVGGGDDIIWRQLDATTRQIGRPTGGNAEFSVLGAVDFGSLDELTLVGLFYSPAPIAGPPVGSDLDIGDVFAMLTNEGNFAKAMVTNHDNGIADRPFYDMHISYAVYDGLAVSVSEPSSAGLLFCYGSSRSIDAAQTSENFLTLLLQTSKCRFNRSLRRQFVFNLLLPICLLGVIPDFFEKCGNTRSRIPELTLLGGQPRI